MTITAHAIVTTKSGVPFTCAEATDTDLATFAEANRLAFSNALDAKQALKMPLADGSYAIVSAADIESIVVVQDSP